MEALNPHDYSNGQNYELCKRNTNGNTGLVTICRCVWWKVKKKEHTKENCEQLRKDARRCVSVCYERLKRKEHKENCEQLRKNARRCVCVWRKVKKKITQRKLWAIKKGSTEIKGGEENERIQGLHDRWCHRVARVRDLELNEWHDWWCTKKWDTSGFFVWEKLQGSHEKHFVPRQDIEGQPFLPLQQRQRFGYSEKLFTRHLAEETWTVKYNSNFLSSSVDAFSPKRKLPNVDDVTTNDHKLECLARRSSVAQKRSQN